MRKEREELFTIVQHLINKQLAIAEEQDYRNTKTVNVLERLLKLGDRMLANDESSQKVNYIYALERIASELPPNQSTVQELQAYKDRVIDL